jgi:hypothetical protein
MKKQILVTLLLALALALITCDDGTKKETPGVPKPTQKTLSFGKVTISSPDEHLPSAWNALCNDVVSALNTAYAAASYKGDYDTVFGGAGAQIVLVNDLLKNWEVKAGTTRGTLYIKIGSIGSITAASYEMAAESMFSNNTANSVD